MIEKYSVPFNKIESLKNGADWIDNNGNIIPNSILTDKNTDSFTYAYCTDTRFSKQLVNKLEGVKLLYHETTFMHDLKERADKTGHSTTIEAATIAKKAKVDRLLIGHYSQRYRDLDELLLEAKSVFKNVDLSFAGMEIDFKLL